MATLRRLAAILFFALIVRPGLLLLTGLRAIGRERLPSGGPAVIAANHNSHLDVVALMSLFPLRLLHRIRPVAAADHFLKPGPIGWLARNILNIIPIDRSGKGAESVLAPGHRGARARRHRHHLPRGDARRAGGDADVPARGQRARRGLSRRARSCRSTSTASASRCRAATGAWCRSAPRRGSDAPVAASMRRACRCRSCSRPTSPRSRDSRRSPVSRRNRNGGARRIAGPPCAVARDLAFDQPATVGYTRSPFGCGDRAACAFRRLRVGDPRRVRRNRRFSWPQVAAMVFLLGAAGIVPARADPRLPDLVETITASLAGRTGFAAQLLGGDTIVALNGDETFPMASAYKLAIVGKVLAMVDKGELRLDQMIDIPSGSYVPSPVIAESFRHPGVALSLANLIELTIVHSDNTAADTLMALAGGPARSHRLAPRDRHRGHAGRPHDGRDRRGDPGDHGGGRKPRRPEQPRSPGVRRRPARSGDTERHAAAAHPARGRRYPETRHPGLPPRGDGPDRHRAGADQGAAPGRHAGRPQDRDGRRHRQRRRASSPCPTAAASRSPSSPRAAPRRQPTATAPSPRPPASSTTSSRSSRRTLSPTRPCFGQDRPPHSLLQLCNRPIRRFRWLMRTRVPRRRWSRSCSTARGRCSRSRTTPSAPSTPISRRCRRKAAESSSRSCSSIRSASTRSASTDRSPRWRRSPTRPSSRAPRRR